MGSNAVEWAWGQTLGIGEKLVLLAIARGADEKGISRQSIEQLRPMVGMSTAYIYRKLNGLKRGGLLEKTGPVKGKNGVIQGAVFALKMESESAREQGHNREREALIQGPESPSAAPLTTNIVGSNTHTRGTRPSGQNGTEYSLEHSTIVENITKNSTIGENKFYYSRKLEGNSTIGENKFYYSRKLEGNSTIGENLKHLCQLVDEKTQKIKNTLIDYKLPDFYINSPPLLSPPPCAKTTNSKTTKKTTRASGHMVSHGSQSGRVGPLSKTPRPMTARPNGDDIEKSFLTFWDRYPKKRKKKNARQIWHKRKLGSKLNTILADIDTRLANDSAWRDKQFIPDPTTYLNGDRWTDEVIVKSANNSPKESGADVLLRVCKSAFDPDVPDYE